MQVVKSSKQCTKFLSVWTLLMCTVHNAPVLEHCDCNRKVETPLEVTLCASESRYLQFEEDVPMERGRTHPKQIVLRADSHHAVDGRHVLQDAQALNPGITWHVQGHLQLGPTKHWCLAATSDPSRHHQTRVPDDP